jgi:hypothetical protein
MPTQKLFVVRRSRQGGQDWRPYSDGLVEKVFLHRTQAERYSLECERSAWQHRDEFHPFHEHPNEVRELKDVTSLDEPVFCDYLRDLDLEPPEPSPDWDRWYRWWEELLPQLSPIQRLRLCEAMDLVRLYEIIEVPCVE